MFSNIKWGWNSQRRIDQLKNIEPVQPFFLVEAIDLSKCMTFIDVGANIGGYSLIVAKNSKVKEIIAYEPSIKACKLFALNASRNNCTVDIRSSVVSNESGIVSFGVVSALSGANAISDGENAHKFRSKINANSVKLDEDVGEIIAPIAIKIDVEGNEQKVLDGAVQILKHPCLIQVESFNDGVQLPSDYRLLTNIGPDYFYTNIVDLDCKEIYMKAANRMVHSNSSSPIASITFGDFSLVVKGKIYRRVKKIIRSILGLNF